MFFGKGDSSQLREEELQTLAHLRRLVETGHVLSLDERMSLVAIRAVAVFDRFESVIAMMESVKNIAMLLGALLVIYAATQGAAVDWIRSVVGG